MATTEVKLALASYYLWATGESISKSWKQHAEDLHRKSSPGLERRRIEEHYEDQGVHAAHLSVLHCICYRPPGVVT